MCVCVCVSNEPVNLWERMWWDMLELIVMIWKELVDQNDMFVVAFISFGG